MLAVTRAQFSVAIRAASSAVRDHSSRRPSGPGRRTGQRKTTPWRLTAVNRARGEQVASPETSGQSGGVDQVRLPVLLQLDDGGLEVVTRLRVDADEPTAVRLADRDRQECFLHPQGGAERLRQPQRGGVERVRTGGGVCRPR